MSERVALRLSLPGVVVTCFVTGSGSPFEASPAGPNFHRRLAHGPRADGRASATAAAAPKIIGAVRAIGQLTIDAVKNQVRLGRWGSVTFPVQNPGSAAVHSTVSGFRATSLAILTSSACASSTGASRGDASNRPAHYRPHHKSRGAIVRSTCTGSRLPAGRADHASPRLSPSRGRFPAWHLLHVTLTGPAHRSTGLLPGGDSSDAMSLAVLVISSPGSA